MRYERADYEIDDDPGIVSVAVLAETPLAYYGSFREDVQNDAKACKLPALIKCKDIGDKLYVVTGNQRYGNPRRGE